MWLHLVLACARAPAPAAEGSDSARALLAVAQADQAAAALYDEVSALQSLCDEPRPGRHLDARPAGQVVADMRAHLDRAQLDLTLLEGHLETMRTALLIESAQRLEETP